MLILPRRAWGWVEQVRVKLGMAADRGQLDLSECDLEEIPAEVFDVPGLKVRQVLWGCFTNGENPSQRHLICSQFPHSMHPCAAANSC